MRTLLIPDSISTECVENLNFSVKVTQLSILSRSVNRVIAETFSFEYEYKISSANALIQANSLSRGQDFKQKSFS